MKQYLDNFKSCLQKEVPFCQAACPFHVPELDFIEKLKRGSFKAAFKTYRNAVGFPHIVGALCPAPCEGACPRKDTDRSIQLGHLERAILAFTKDTKPADYNLPKKQGRIGIIGGGISGLACALRLATKKYDVVVYEKSDRLGGHLWDVLDSEIFLGDIEEQFQFETYDLRLHTEITSLDTLKAEGFQAIYVATGIAGADFGLLAEAEPCFRQGDMGVFGGGSLLGKSTMYALADGLNMATTIDNFLKTGNLVYTKDTNSTAMCLEPSHLQKQAPVVPSGQDGAFTKEEAVAEAARCMECQCDACRIHCDLTEFFQKWPLRIRDEIQATTLPGSAEVKATPAKRLISTCNQCGLCKETCPKDIDLGGLILAARKSMHQQKKAPWPFHDFWLRDMDFANGDFCAVAKAPSGMETCKYALFPGCQLGASDPALVIKSYEYLLEQEPATGLMLSCCGVPAQWAGDDARFQTTLQQVASAWESLGKPVLLLACPTCRRTFEQHLPHIPTRFLYEQMAAWGLDTSWKTEDCYSVFDPCSTRGMETLRTSVRTLAQQTGAQLKPLEWQERYSHCCGYGGQVAVANPEFADFVAKRRIGEGADPYLTYCVNCRDIFLEEGKESLHILNLLFREPPPKPLPTVSQRRDNRVFLKETVLKKFWKEAMDAKQTTYDFTLRISDALREKLHKARILEEEMYNVVDFCERHQRTVYNQETDTYTGYRQIGHATYWAEYRKTPTHFLLVNGYSHRMEIELEVVWNGRKTDTDLQ